MTLGFSHIMGAKKKIMLPIDSASLKTYKITIYLYFFDDYSQKIWNLYRGLYQIWCYPKKPISHQITDGYDLSVVTFSFISNNKPMITNILCKLKLDIVFRVRCGSPDYCFVGPIRKQRTDFQSCKPGPTSCACLALGTRLGCYG